MTEFEIISRLFTWKMQRGLTQEVLLSSGDDCAVVNPQQINGSLAITTDTLVEGVHFFKNPNPALLAHKILLVNLSDLAAMGAVPSFITLSLVLDDRHAKDDFLIPFAKELKKACKKYRISLVGGNLSGGGEFSVTVTAFGHCVRPLTRSAACKGDLIAVTGSLGASGLYVEEGYGRIKVPKQYHKSLERSFFKPPLRTSFAAMASPLLHAAIDISDGVIGDLGHILKAGKKGAVLFADKLPLGYPIHKLKLGREKEIELALFGGGDYELLFTFDKNNLDKLQHVACQCRTPFTVIGSINGRAGSLQVVDDNNLEIKLKGLAFDHFLKEET